MNNISFIIPAFNCEKTIGESIRSILNSNFQTGDEIIIVNDCSTDNTKKIIEDIQKNNSDKVIIISHDKNMGGGAARNTAVKYAKNDLIFCLDSDNILEPKSIEPLKQMLLNDISHGAAAFQKVKYFKNDIKNITHEWLYIDNIVFLKDALCGHNNPPSSGNYLFTKKSWQMAGGYPEDVSALDAWGFGIRQLATGSSVLILPNFGYYHRHGHTSYWIRENNAKTLSIKARSILLPYFDKILIDDVTYLENSSNWFDKINIRPIRVATGETGLDGKVTLFNKINFFNINNLFKRIMNRLFTK